jgi:hypothetical protein
LTCTLAGRQFVGQARRHEDSFEGVRSGRQAPRQASMQFGGQVGVAATQASSQTGTRTQGTRKEGRHALCRKADPQFFR